MVMMDFGRPAASAEQDKCARFASALLLLQKKLWRTIHGANSVPVLPQQHI